MQNKSTFRFGFFNLRTLIVLLFCAAAACFILIPVSSGIASLRSEKPGTISNRTQWVARYNGPVGFGDDSAAAIAVDSSGNVYVTGEGMNLNADLDYATIKYDSAGQEQWVARYSGPGNFDDATAIAIDSSGNAH